MDTNANALEVHIRSEGGTLTLTPQGLLQHFLPGATPLPNNPRVFEGRVPGQPDKRCYVQTEALAGMLMTAREMSINPISGMYLIPSNHPDKPANHKVKYDVGLTRARRIPGFLGINSGLLVLTKLNPDVLIDRPGSLPHPGDEIWGAWAEGYIAGLAQPIRHEISKEQFWGISKIWNDKGPWMLCKVAEDQLARLKLAALCPDPAPGAIGPLQETEDTEDGPLVAAADSSPTPEGPEQEPFAFAPGVQHIGTIVALTPVSTKENGKQKAGSVILDTADGELLAYFYSRPEILRQTQDWNTLIGQMGALTFKEQISKANGMAYRYVEAFALTPDPMAGDGRED